MIDNHFLMRMYIESTLELLPEKYRKHGVSLISKYDETDGRIPEEEFMDDSPVFEGDSTEDMKKRYRAMNPVDDHIKNHLNPENARKVFGTRIG